MPGLVPDDIFFAYLARRRFPSTCFIRRRDQLDYLQEPDVFHDIYGHVPMLMNPVFADYMQAYGEGGLKALRLGHLEQLARLYWYTVEFGLIATREGLRIYGSGILSSAGESVYCLDDPRPNRLRFDLRRVMRTQYHIDRYPGDLFRHRRFRAAVRGDAARFRADLSRDRGVAGDSAGRGAARRAGLRAPGARAKKKGRT